MPQQRKVKFIYNNQYKFELEPEHYLPAAFLRSGELIYHMTAGFIGYLTRPAFDMTIEEMNMNLTPSSSIDTQFTKIEGEGMRKTYDWDIAMVDGRQVIRGMTIRNIIFIEVDCDDDLTPEYLETEAYQTLEKDVLFNITYYGDNLMDTINELPITRIDLGEGQTLDFKFECKEVTPIALTPVFNGPEYAQTNALIRGNLHVMEMVSYNSNAIYNFENGEFNVTRIEPGAASIKRLFNQTKVGITAEDEEDYELMRPQSEIIQFLNSNNTKVSLEEIFNTMIDIYAGIYAGPEEGIVAAAAGKRNHKRNLKNIKTSKKKLMSIFKKIFKQPSIKSINNTIKKETMKLKKMKKHTKKCVYIKNKKGVYVCKTARKRRGNRNGKK
jgi:hypothetical protein